jgi:hypothetical protein
MPDVREVYEMVTKQKPPEPGALQRQQKRQIRSSRNKRIGAFAMAAAIGLVAVVLILANRPTGKVETPAAAPTTGYPVDPAATEVATSFVQAVGAFDADRAVSYLTDSAEVPEGLGPDGLPMLISLYEAQGYKQMLDPCRVTGTSASGTAVECPFDFHIIRSDEIGRGPYQGSYWTITVTDGEISYAVQDWDIEEFSSQMWEPFADWVSSTHPKDFDEMYTGGGSNFRLTEESVKLWEQNSKEYVKEVQRGNAE